MIRATTHEVAARIGATLWGAGDRTVEGVATDSRELVAGNLFFALRGARVDGHDFVPQVAAAGAAAAVVSRQVPVGLPQLLVADPLRALGRLATVARADAPFHLAAITGSVAKTTTKEFLAALLATTFSVGFTKGNRNSEVGFPVELLNQPAGIEWMVAELGMSHAGELDRLGTIAQPDALLYTVIAPVHLEFFPDLEAIADAKAELIPHLRSSGLLVLNAADARVAAFATRFAGRTVRYGVPGGSDLWIEQYQSHGLLGAAFALTGPLGHADITWTLAGRHQADNLLAAAALALAVGAPSAALPACAAGLRAAPRRGEVLRLPGAVTVVDDSYNSSPEAARALLALLAATPGRRVAVLGEMLELGATAPALHREVGRRAGAAAQVVVAVGGNPAAELARAANGAEAHHVADAGAALTLVRSLVRPGDVVLVKGSRGIGLDRVVDGLREGVA